VVSSSYCQLRFLLRIILVFTIIVDYFAGILIEKNQGQQRKLFLIISICANVAVLAYFKYYNFFIDNFQVLFHYFHSSFPLSILKIILPLGLSFHTFQAMSYTIEVYRGNQKAERHFGIYALYVMFYPQLVAGPIERPQNLLHQFKEEHHFDYDMVTSGLKLMMWGLFKKVVIADNVSTFVDLVYHTPKNFSGLPLIVATFFYAIQIYCDFSGYSDMAIGSARVMGFTLMKNFDRPYFSSNIGEAWRRWHISLSTWLRDYLYTPISLGVRQWGEWAIVFALIITFLIAGLWHGADWKFAFFGLLHGIAISYESLTRRWRKRISKKIPLPVYTNVSILLTFIYWNFTLVFFRARSFSDAGYIVTHCLNKTFCYQLGHLVYGLSAVKVWFDPFDFIKLPLIILILLFMDILQNYVSPVNFLSQKPSLLLQLLL